MPSPLHLRRSAALLSVSLAVSLAAHAQVSSLPPTPPTAIAPIASNPMQTPAATRPHRAEVVLGGGMLTVRANDSSLRQILSSISRQTGMTITGGVEDQRVFGSYGPAQPSVIIATLLDGTGVNMLIKEDEAHAPISLVLTPRTGGTTPAITPQDDQSVADEPASQPAAAVKAPVPPSPSTQPATAQPAAVIPAQPTVSGPVRSPQPANNVLGNPNNVTPTASQIPTTNSVPIDAIPTPTTTVQTQQGIVDTPNQPSPAAATSTPQSIFEQLQQLQKARAAAAAGTPATPPPATPPQ